MVKSDIVSALCEKGYYKNQATDVSAPQKRGVCTALVQGEQVQIRGFGTFEVKTHKGRKSLDISTGQMRVFEDCKVPSFRASDSLKETVRSCNSAGK